MSDAAQLVLSAAFDRLVPAVDELPAAGAMGLLPEVERMAARHAGYGRAWARVAAAVSAAPGLAGLPGGRQDEAIRRIEAAMPVEFAAVLELVYLAYYSRPEVAARIGWRAGPLQPLGFELPPFDEASLEMVRRRPPFWRGA